MASASTVGSSKSSSSAVPTSCRCPPPIGRYRKVPAGNVSRWPLPGIDLVLAFQSTSASTCTLSFSRARLISARSASISGRQVVVGVAVHEHRPARPARRRPAAAPAPRPTPARCRASRGAASTLPTGRQRAGRRRHDRRRHARGAVAPGKLRVTGARSHALFDAGRSGRDRTGRSGVQSQPSVASTQDGPARRRRPDQQRDRQQPTAA